MGLKEYKAKRDVKKSREPEGVYHPSSETLNFCVQKHDASHLHYDFRLEFRGVLLSWAVPKGPSMNPKDKRLAIHVEDHPLNYQYFEGVIPKGNYGAGTVEIWDHGTYTTPHFTEVKEIEKYITEGLKKGHFAFILQGDKLNGEFVLQKLKPHTDDKSWLLIKKGDETAKTESTHHISKKKIESLKPGKLPDFISPMLATLVKTPFNDEDWLYEIKWDGYRALAFIENGKVQLKSRNKLVWNEKFPSLIQDLEKIRNQVILDGEIVVVDAQGKSHFQLMQNYQSNQDGTLLYYVFDILFKDGKDLRQTPLIERKEILKKFIKELSLPLIRFSDHVINHGIELFKEATKNHLEGIIGKNIVSPYQSSRSKDWVKIKTSSRQEVVIGGFTAPKGSREEFGALMIGVYNEKKEFISCGHVGGGFTDLLLKEIYQKLAPLVQKKCPFKKEPKTNGPVTWVKPQLVCEVSFTEWTQDNSLRHPIFQGLREDKKAHTVIKEEPENMTSEKKTTAIKAHNLVKKEKTATKNELILTHLDKVYWPKEEITKGDLIEYYRKVANYILPYLKDRPIMLHRYPNGIEGKDFYQKDIAYTLPSWLHTVPVQHEGKIDNYLLINNLNSLLYAINLGSIDLHPFMSRSDSLDHPDYCLIDLDPHEIDFKHVVDVALMIHTLLDEMKVVNFCKTSGGNGLHILIPLKGEYTYEQSRQFATLIAMEANKKFPSITSLERDPKKRPKKIYLDCLQNRTGQTMVAPYAVRPRPGARVSTPLLWEEVNENLNRDDYTLKTLPARLKLKGDLLKPLLAKKINIKKALNLLQKFTNSQER